jgi:hypothetical protein
MKNARFWVYLNRGPAKITLAPGQSLTWSQASQTEEGWSARSETWEYDGETVSRVSVEDARDCDGRLTHTTQLKAGPADLRAGPKHAGVTCPTWTRVKARVFDEFAQAAGY